ncbi:nSTAND1 domain-containing NTPase [Nonomuraea fuscirosea]|uniref:nSTAND1 domain-containing NTPase n=1 Tax=Nonomuraea fuscirosea TaxID=1291556 RepID=UPI003425FAB6
MTEGGDRDGAEPGPAAMRRSWPPDEAAPGAVLRRLRIQRGLSLTELSRLTHYSKGYLSKVETGEKALSEAVARQCDAVLRTDGELTGLAGPVARAGDGCPYRGLQPYGTEDARWFFGRDRMVGVLVERLAERMRVRRPLIVVAPSGAGKTSLLRAGLLPALRRGALPEPGSRSWPAVVLTPGKCPVAELLAGIGAPTGLDPAHLAGVLADDPAAFAARVAGALNDGAREGGPAARLVLVVDQLEELFTLCADEAERRTFLAALDALASAGPDGKPAQARAPGRAGQPAALVVLGVRADCYDRCLAHPVLLETLREGRLPLGPMTVAELREAITGPAREARLNVEPALGELLLRDMGVAAGADGLDSGPAHEPGTLALLSHALWATWQQREDGTLTVAGYRLTGGITGAVAATAERVHSGLGLDDQDLARRLLLHLVRVEDSGAETRRPIDVGQLPAAYFPPRATGEVIEAFAAARLITLSSGSARLAHEALLRAWPRLREWIVADREGLRVHRHLAEAAQAWEREHRDAALLYRGVRLRTAEEWAGERPGAPTTLEREFLDACLVAENARREAAVRRARRRRRRIAVLTALLVVTASAGVFAVRQRDVALDRRAQALSLRLAAQSELAGGDVATAARLAATAWRLAPTPEARAAMTALLSRPARAVLPSTATALAVSPDGRLVAGAAHDGTTLWDTTTRRPLGAPLTGHRDGTSAVAFSPDGRTLAGGGTDGTILLWDVATRRRIGVPLTGRSRVLGLAFRPGGRTLATVDASGTLRVWDLASAEAAGSVRTGGDVAFSSDGRLLAGYAEGVVRLWDTATLRPLRSIPTGAGALDGGGVSAMAFSPDGRLLATGLASLDEPESVRFWDVATGRPAGAPLPGHDFGAGAMAFAPGGNVLATSDSSRTRLWDVTTRRQIGSDLPGHHSSGVSSLVFTRGGAGLWSGDVATVRVWDVAVHHPIGAPLTGPAQSVGSVAFSPDGKLLAGGDRTARLWDVTARRPSGGPLAAQGPGWIRQVAFSPDGKLLAGAGDRAVRLWDVTTRRPAGAPLTGHRGAVHSIAFSADGRLLASASEDHTIRLWDVATRLPAGALTGHQGAVHSIAFSPDGRLLATAGGTDLTIRLWDVSTRRPAGAPLRAHGDAVWDVAFSPDGRLLASASEDHTIRLWDVATRQPAGAPLTGHGYPVVSVAFSPDGRQVASAGGHDFTARLWDVATRQPVGIPLVGHGDAVWSVAFAPDGRSLATSSADATVRLWNLDRPADPVAALCDIAGRPLTPAEWNRYLPGEEYQEVCPRQAP